MSEYDSFSIYGFSTVYPIAWKIELDPNQERSKGNVTFKSPQKANIVVNWGSLEKARKKYSSIEEHAKDSINRIKKEPKVRRVQLLQTKDIQVNSHKAIFSHVRIIFSMPNLLPFRKAKTYEQEVHSLHLYCKPSKRCFVIYGITTPNESLQQDRIFKIIIKSFRCHKPKTKPH
jgi:hypothetical protein